MRGQASWGLSFFRPMARRPSEGAERPNNPRYPYTFAEITRSGFELGSRVGRGHFQNRNPGPAGPRPDTQSGPEGARGRDSRGAARTPPRSPAGRAGRPPKGAPMRTGAPKPRRAHGAERVGTANTPSGTLVVSCRR